MSRAMPRALLVAVAAIVVTLVCRRQRRALHLVSDDDGNEALVVRAPIGAGRPMLFMVDTAYAGAPVLSTSYLATPPALLSGVEAEYRAVARALRALAPEAHHAALDRFLSEHPCRSFTSGCTMRLMGIGATSEMQAAMLLCPAMRADRRAEGDVFVTHPLPLNVHILTIDYLLHRAPCVLAPRAGEIVFRAPPWRRASFDVRAPTLVGGAMCVEMVVGGARLRIVVDTGAAASLSIASTAAARLETCRAARRKATQRGVHGEDVCSDVLLAPVRVGSLDLGDVEVFVNSADVEGADGYAGMGLLRALDLWLAPGEIGFRRNGLPPARSRVLADGACGGGLPACAR